MKRKKIVPLKWVDIVEETNGTKWKIKNKAFVTSSGFENLTGPLFVIESNEDEIGLDVIHLGLTPNSAELLGNYLLKYAKLLRKFNSE